MLLDLGSVLTTRVRVRLRDQYIVLDQAANAAGVWCRWRPNRRDGLIMLLQLQAIHAEIRDAIVDAIPESYGS